MATPPPLIADRYQLLERLGAGGMGEVWKAQDTRFESRFVAIKLLKEDDTFRQDAENRDRLAQSLKRESAGLTTAGAEAELDAVLKAGKGVDNLRAKVASRAGDTGRLSSDAVLALYDELVHDTTCSENARTRARLRKLFRDEANAVANLRHDNVVGISDYGEFEGAPYLVMSYIEGQTLARIIQRNVPLTRIRQLELMENLCAGLAYAHDHNLVHRDIKPANLIVDDATGSLKVLDFGVVRRLRPDSESTVGVAIGTLCYMSPEQVRGLAVDRRSDIFSVGDVFYELLSRRMAFPVGEGGLEIVEMVSRIQNQAPTPIRELVPDIEPEIEAILDRALQKDVNARYQTLTEMQRDLARLRGRLENDNATVRITPESRRPTSQPVSSAATEVLAHPSAETQLAKGKTTAGHAATTLRREVPAAEAAAATVVVRPTPPPAAVPPVATGASRAMWAGGVAMLVVAIGLAAYLFRSGSPAVPPPAAQTSLVTIDIHPWAHVKIVPTDGAKPSGTPETYTTPFFVQLAAGHYRLDCDNGGDTASFPITVEVGQPLRVDQKMPKFDVDAAVDRVLGKNK